MGAIGARRRRDGPRRGGPDRLPWRLLLQLATGLLRLVVGIGSGSLAVVADAMRSAVAAFSSLLGLLAHRLADPGPDRDHPYGHQKYQAVASLAIVALLLLTALEILRSVVLRALATPPPTQTGPLGLLLLVIAVVLQIATPGRPRQAIWPSLAVLAGVVAASRPGLAWLDLALAVPLALLLMRSCLLLLRDNLPLLVDQIAIAPEAIHEVAMGVPGVLNCHDIASRGVVGQQVFIDMHMVVEADDLPTAHRITELVEEHLNARYGPCRCTIHLEPREYATATITYRGTHG